MLKVPSPHLPGVTERPLGKPHNGRPLAWNPQPPEWYAKVLRLSYGGSLICVNVYVFFLLIFIDLLYWYSNWKWPSSVQILHVRNVPLFHMHIPGPNFAGSYIWSCSTCLPSLVKIAKFQLPSEWQLKSN